MRVGHVAIEGTRKRSLNVNIKERTRRGMKAASIAFRRVSFVTIMAVEWKILAGLGRRIGLTRGELRTALQASTALLR